MMLLSISTFAFTINETALDLKVKVGERKEKKFILENENTYALRYKISLEGSNKEVKVTPNILIVPSFEQKEFEISVMGITKGEKKYKLILEEDAIDLKSKVSSAKIKMKYRIEQKYVVE